MGFHIARLPLTKANYFVQKQKKNNGSNCFNSNKTKKSPTPNVD